MDQFALDKAFKAGAALPSVQWPADATDDQRRVGEHHCPFSPGDPQRTAWLQGLADALGKQVVAGAEAPAVILQRINDGLEANDHAG